jgi:dienelactone hydrolase
MLFPWKFPILRLGLVLCAFLAGGLARAADPPAPTERGERMLDAYFRNQTRQIADACLAGIKTRADWEKQRPELRRQFLEMMGLWPLPPKTDLKPVVTGKVETEHFTVEKLYFQSRPGLYVTGNLYVPKKADFPAPAILYVCGHGNTVIDKVSYGSKVTYQHHPAWFAEHGYVCLIIDTLQLGEVQGIHHGTHRFNMWWWHTLGYTSAGIECWNGMRALDYLQTRKEVDMKRIGVTGRSGGGAYSWWLAAADERPACFVPVAGIADLQAQVVEGVAARFRKGVINGHCDCMFFVNTYRWDFPMVVALAAPRPCLLGNSDSDDIFPVPGYRRLADKVRPIYELYGAAEKFDLLETAGPHKDTPELRRGACAWMNRWLKNDRGEVAEPERPRLTPQQLKVWDRLPEDEVNTRVQELFIRPASVELPKVPEVAREWWAGQSKEWLGALREKVFRGWPERPPPLAPLLAADIKHNGLRLRALDFQSEEAADLRLWLLTADHVEKPALVVLTAVDEPGWQNWLAEVGPAFKEALLVSGDIKLDEQQFERNRRVLEKEKWAFATLAPRGIGPTRWRPLTPNPSPPRGEGSKPVSPLPLGERGGGEGDDATETHIKRRFALLGQTLDGQRVWDVRRGVELLRRLPDLQGVPLWLQGKGDMAGIVLYAGLFEPEVVRFDLWHPPASHHQGPIFLNVRRVLDMPQAMALAFPRQLRVYVKDQQEANRWTWPLELQKTLGQEYLKIRTIPD